MASVDLTFPCAASVPSKKKRLSQAGAGDEPQTSRASDPVEPQLPRHVTLWTTSALPYNSLRVIGVPPPLGGLLVLATNALFYLQRGAAPVGIALNSLAALECALPLRPPPESLRAPVTLDGACALFVAPNTLLACLKNGDIYSVTLQCESLERAVRAFGVEKVAAAVLTTCACRLDDSHLFLGSRLSSSLLLRFVPKSDGAQQSLAAPSTFPALSSRAPAGNSTRPPDTSISKTIPIEKVLFRPDEFCIVYYK